ncbi:MAG: hypothetical protein GF310_09230 [candidate division Zixibacteria bacterium]|nr:hypothetical protein [candidate division Zixibacteria bacterium]
MKNPNTIIIISIFSLLGLLPISSDLTASDFRNADWYMTPQEVMAVEDVNILTDATNGNQYWLFCDTVYLFYHSSELTYEFYDNGLVRADYEIITDNYKALQFLEAYDEFKAALTKKYGQPIEDKSDQVSFWLGDSTEIWWDDDSTAFEIGQLSKKAKWQTRRTIIELDLNSGVFSDSPWIAITYKSIEHENLETERREKRELDKL